MSRFLPPPTAERIIASALKGDTRAMQELVTWYRAIWSFLGNINSLPWEVVDKAGSKLSDLETREHAMLQEVLGWLSGADTEQVRHISNADGKVWQDHVEITDGNPHGTDHDMLDAILGTGDRHITEAENAEITALDALAAGMMAKTGNAAYTSRTITGTAGEVEVANGDGGAGNPTIGLPELISTPRSFGTETDNTTIEADGTVKFNNAATVWKDIFFPMAPPKATGAGNPTLTIWNGNLRGYTFAVGDVHDFDPQEFNHDGKQGSEATWHIHFVSRTNVGANRAVKYQLEYSQANRNGVFPAPTTVSAEFVIPANTTANTHFAEDIATFTTGNIAGQMFVRLTRIAAAGTAPADDPVVIGVHYHYSLDTVGSREIFSK